MSGFSQISHPLSRDGQSQKDRIIDALKTNYVQIDDRSWADLLTFIYEFAKQLNHYDESAIVEDWTIFFDNSIPFRIARINNFDLTRFKENYSSLHNSYNNQQGRATLNPLLHFLFDAIHQINDWYSSLNKDYSDFGIVVGNMISTNLRHVLTRLIGYSNAAQNWGYQRKTDLTVFLNDSKWQLGILDKFKIDNSILQYKGSETHKVVSAKKHLDELFETLFQSITQIVNLAPKYLAKSILQSQEHEPMLGLIFSFLRLFKRSRNDLNNLTKRHLDYFYKDILRLSEKKAIPDKAYLTFELAKPKIFTEFLLKKDTGFKAGKDSLKKEIIFNLEDEIVVQKAQIKSLKTIFLDQTYAQNDPGKETNPNIVKDVYIAPQANTADGHGEKFTSDSPSWPTLGSELSKFQVTEENADISLQSHPKPDLGLILASRILFLPEGDRIINITIDCAVPDNIKAEFNRLYTSIRDAINTKFVFTDQIIKSLIEENATTYGFLGTLKKYERIKFIDGFNDYLNRNLNDKDKLLVRQSIRRDHAFSVLLSGEEWIQPHEVEISIPESKLSSDTLSIKISLHLYESDKAVTFFNKKALEEDYATDLPVIKLLFNHNAKIDQNTSLYHFFRFLKITNTIINVSVNGIKNLIVQNDSGLLDINKPLLPFGSAPVKGANFYIGSKEIFQKKLTSLDLYLTWDSLPDNNHYDFYQDTFSRNDIQTEVCVLKNKEWVSLGKDNTELLNPSIIIDNFDSYKEAEIKELNNYNVSTQNGFLRLRLGDKTFLHDNYTPSLAIQASAIGVKAYNLSKIITNAKYYYLDTGKVDFYYNFDSPIVANLIPKLPNEPYTPVISELKVNYKAESSDSDIILIHLHPFDKTYSNENIKNSPTLLTTIINEGSLFMGIEELIPGNNLDILFKMAESTADPEIDKADIKWEYLSNNSWKPMRTDFEILSDETNGLIQSGIIKMAIPKDINNTNTIMPAKLYWLKVRSYERTAAVCETINVHSQSAKVIFKDQENDLSRLNQPLVAGSISKFVNDTVGIKKFEQLYDSFGGKAKESEDKFYIRVSEHLRHKGRAINLYDYEQLTLEQFPDIFKVKCITHTLGRKGEPVDFELSPGFVTLAVIPDVESLQYAQKLRPKATLSTLENISKYLKSKSSPFVRINVLNPRYEEIKVKGNIRFKAGKSNEFYIEQLKKDILEFLTPWAYGEQEKLSFGGKIYKSSILNFVEGRTYVDYVSDFIMMDEDNNIKNEITAKTARSILVSGTHSFEAITVKCCIPKDTEEISDKGIGQIKIGNKN